MTNLVIVNALTIDVEDYYQVHAFSDVIRSEDWDSFEPRLETNTYHILDLLDTLGPKPRSTFFILGWNADRYPALVREIHARGHEVACHGYAHKCIFNQTQREFREDVRKAKEVLENITGVQVIGYRAPTYSITSDTVWALEVLFELGFRYDSSIFPIKHDVYGFPKAPRFPFYIDFTNDDLPFQLKNPEYMDQIDNPEKGNTGTPPTNQQLLGPDARFIEFPVSTITLLGCNLPFCGGGYFRLFPYWYARWGLNKINKRFKKPAIFYIHPWELDPEIPKIDAPSPFSKFRTYVNLERTAMRFKRLLTEFGFAPLASMIK